MNQPMPIAAPPVKESLMNQISDRIVSYNNSQTSMLNSIEEKLHKILNKRNPEVIAGVEEPHSDYVGSMGKSLDTMRSNTDRLDKVLTHLAEII